MAIYFSFFGRTRERFVQILSQGHQRHAVLQKIQRFPSLISSPNWLTSSIPKENTNINTLTCMCWLEIMYLWTNFLIPSLLLCATYIRLLVRSHRLQKESKLYTWIGHSSYNIYHGPQVQIHSIQLKYPMISSNPKINTYLFFITFFKTIYNNFTYWFSFL